MESSTSAASFISPAGTQESTVAGGSAEREPDTCAGCTREHARRSLNLRTQTPAQNATQARHPLTQPKPLARQLRQRLAQRRGVHRRQRPAAAALALRLLRLKLGKKCLQGGQQGVNAHESGAPARHLRGGWQVGGWEAGLGLGFGFG